MYKVVIIDDEPIIRQGLRTIVDWENFHIEICGEAENGIEGLSLCCELKPDLAIIDLKMPGLDGIELIEEARRLGVETDFIVLSGYSEFTYAQKATEFGVRSYLVKPIEPTQLIAKLHVLRNEWEERDKLKEQWQVTAKLRVEHALQKLCEDESGAFLANAAPSELAPFLTSDGKLWGTYHLYLLGEERERASLTIWRQLQKCIEEQMSDTNLCVTGFINQYLVVLTDSHELCQLVNSLVADKQQFVNIQLVVAAGEPVSYLSDISLAYREASQMMKDRFLYDRQGSAIIKEKLCEEIGGEVSIESYAAKAAEHIAAEDEAAIRQMMLLLERKLRFSNWEEDTIKSAYAAFYTETVGHLAAIDDKVRSYIQPLHNVAEQLKLCCTLHEVSYYIEQEFYRLTAGWSKMRKHDTFSQILDYISDHYGAGLTLESIARTFHYNSSYLGKLFKAQTGKTFNAYLDEVRMKQAKRLLAQGAKVYEAAAAVGFANVDYFHAKFKRLEGETPSAYRERWRGGQRS